MRPAARVGDAEDLRATPPGDEAVAAVRLVKLTARHLRGAAAVDQAVSARPWPVALLARELEDPQQRCYLAALAERGDRWSRAAVVGFGGVQQRPDSAHVTNLAVAPAWQGRGLGRRLLVALLDQVSARGWGPTTLEVRSANSAARRLYAGAGFHEAGRRPGYYTEPPDDAIIMWRPADDARAAPTAHDDPGEARPC